MLDTETKQRVDSVNHAHAELSHKFTLFIEIAISIKHDLKNSGIDIELIKNYLHAYFLDEELIFKYRPYIRNATISGMITVSHRHRGLDENLIVTPITEFYFDHLGNISRQPDMKNSMETMSSREDVFSIIIEATSKLLDSDIFHISK